MPNDSDSLETCACGDDHIDSCPRCGAIPSLPDPPTRPVYASPPFPTPRAVDALSISSRPFTADILDYDNPPASVQEFARASGLAVPAPQWRARRPPVGAAAMALVVVIAFALCMKIRSASSGQPRKPLIVNIGIGAIQCEDGQLPDMHKQPTLTTYRCRWGGTFTCATDRCIAYNWHRDEARQRWETVNRGGRFSLASGMFYNIEKDAP